MNVPESGCSPLLGQAPADAEGKLSPKALPIQKLEYRGVRYAEPGFMIPANSM